jgi:hypothetical protein
MSENESMKKAYRIAQELLNDRLKEKDPDAYRELQSIKDADVIIVPGRYDHIESVLSLSDTPFTLVDTESVDTIDLRPDQIVFINCPGEIRTRGLRKIEAFVNEGGFLFTTDWALKHVLEEIFPGYLEYNHKSTADEVVRVDVRDTEDPFLKSILGPNDDPQWWLEGSSYPIRILNQEKVKVLVTSNEIKQKYGEAPVFVTFDHGAGKIYHMISHFYLQRSETRTQRHAKSAAAYMEEKQIPAYLKEKYRMMQIQDSRLGDVESAYTSNAMMRKVMFDKKLQMRQRRTK